MRLEAAEVKARTSIREVVGRVVELKRTSDGRWSGRCPFHAEKTPSFQVREREQRWHCFGCDEGGDVIDFVMRVERCTLPEALKKLSGMEIVGAPPVALWAKDYVIPCSMPGCTESLEVDAVDVPHLGRGLHGMWSFRKRTNGDIDGMCAECGMGFALGYRNRARVERRMRSGWRALLAIVFAMLAGRHQARASLLLREAFGLDLDEEKAA